MILTTPPSASGRSGGNFLEVPAGAGDGAAGAGADHAVRDPAVGVVPDLRAGGLVVAGRGGRVGELVRLVGAGDLGDEPVRDAVVALRAVRGDGGGRHHHFGAVGLEHGALVLAHLVRHHEDAAVALLLGHERQADAGVAGGGLHDGAAGQEFAGSFGLLDHLRRDAVLDRTAGVQVFQLHQDGGRDAIGHVVEFDERRMADEVQNGLGVLHRYKVTVSGRAGTSARPRLRQVRGLAVKRIARLKKLKSYALPAGMLLAAGYSSGSGSPCGSPRST